MGTHSLTHSLTSWLAEDDDEDNSRKRRCFAGQRRGQRTNSQDWAPRQRLDTPAAPDDADTPANELRRLRTQATASNPCCAAWSTLNNRVSWHDQYTRIETLSENPGRGLFGGLHSWVRDGCVSESFASKACSGRSQRVACSSNHQRTNSKDWEPRQRLQTPAAPPDLH